MKPIIPPELHEAARYPAYPGTPAAVATPGPLKGSIDVKIIAPHGGHALLDLYFCAIVPAVIREYGIPVVDADRFEATRAAWELAIAALRTRPDTGPVPASLPADPLK